MWSKMIVGRCHYDDAWVQWFLRWSLVHNLAPWSLSMGRLTQNGKASVNGQTNSLVHICYAAPVSGAALANPGRVPSCIAHDTIYLNERF